MHVYYYLRSHLGALRWGWLSRRSDSSSPSDVPKLPEEPVAMTLGARQRRFTLLVSELIAFAYTSGYELTFGDAYRSVEQAKRNEALGVGKANSLHCVRLAIDFNLFCDGKYLTKTTDHQELGEDWESLDPDCRWGGRFNDGNHYSMIAGPEDGRA